jgi:hypothetical protein
MATVKGNGRPNSRVSDTRPGAAFDYLILRRALSSDS